MKKFAATFCIVGTALTLAACDATPVTNPEIAAPYASERTAGAQEAPAERVFRKAQSK